MTTTPITTLSSREFNQGASEAKRAANKGPVFITDRGRPAHVLLSFEDYQRLARHRQRIGNVAPPRVRIQPRPADFS